MALLDQEREVERLLDKADANLLAGGTEAAVRDLQEVLRLDPRNLRARGLFGLCAVAAGDLATAEKNLQYVLKHDPENAVAHEGMRRLGQRRAGAAAPAPLAAHPPGPTGLGRVLQALRHLATYGFAILLGSLFVPLAVLIGWSITIGNSPEFDRFFLRSPVYFAAATAGIVTFWFIARLENRREDRSRDRRWAERRAHHRDEITSAKEAREMAARRKAVDAVAKRTARRPRRPSVIGTLGMALIWIVLLAAGALAGYLIGSSGGRDPDNGLIGAVLGVLASQVLQVLIFRRRR